MRDSPHAPIPAISVGDPPALSPQKELASQAAGGNIVATRRLLESVAPRMKRAVMAVMGANNPDVDDVLQQSLIALVQALPSYRGECEPSYFGSRIAVRTAMAARKRTRAAWARRDDEAETDALVSTDPQPHEMASDERRRTVVRELLERIPEEQAETMAMRFMLGWSLEEVAQATRVPLNTVRSRLRLAKEALRKRIEIDPVLAEELEVFA